MFQVMLVVGGGGSQIDHPQKNTTVKKPSFIVVKLFRRNCK